MAVAVRQGAITRWLKSQSNAVFAGYAIFAAFSVYFCMYAFRKPFSAAAWDGQTSLFGVELDLKILLIVSQVIGYCLSKFLGIKIISEMGPRGRAIAIIGLILVAQLALLLLPLLPHPWTGFAMFLNGLPLGMVWGLVFSFLEGRQLSEVLGAGLSASYILASGYVKRVGKWCILPETDGGLGLSESWMPFTVGLMFFPVLIMVVFLLSQLPQPTADDEAARVRREPMHAAERLAFLRRFAPGLLPLTGLYMLLTAYRDFRDNFAADIWIQLGYGSEPSILSDTEIPIALGVMLALAGLNAIRDNRRALLAVHVVMGFGTAMVGIATWLYESQLLGPVGWFIAVGLGLYLAYVPFGCMLFDRLIASVGVVATAGFMIYVTDAFGYLGSVGLLLYKNFGEANLSWMEFFIGASYVTSVVCCAAFAGSAWYFWGQSKLLVIDESR